MTTTYRCDSGCCLVRTDGARPRIQVTYNGHAYGTIAEMAAEIGMAKCTLRDRLMKQKCLAAPLQKKPGRQAVESVDYENATEIALCNRFLRARA